MKLEGHALGSLRQCFMHLPQPPPKHKSWIVVLVLVYYDFLLMTVSQSLQELHEMFYDLAVLVEEQVGTASVT